MTRDKGEDLRYKLLAPLEAREVLDDDLLTINLMDQMVNIGVNVFKWTCPTWDLQYNDIPKYQIETLLFEGGSCTVFKDPVTDEFYALPLATENIAYNAYGLPSKWKAVAMGVQGGRFGRLELDKSNAVIIWNNPRRTPTIRHVQWCVKQMVMCQRNIYNNYMCLRNQIVWQTTDTQSLDAKVLMEMREAGALYVIRIQENGQDPQSEVINLNVKNEGAEYNDMFNNYRNQALAHMGLDSVQVDKKERALTDEVNANNDSTSGGRDGRLAQRLKAVDEMHALWPDLDVSVEVNPVLLKHDALIAESPFNNPEE